MPPYLSWFVYTHKSSEKAYKTKDPMDDHYADKNKALAAAATEMKISAQNTPPPYNGQMYAVAHDYGEQIKSNTKDQKSYNTAIAPPDQSNAPAKKSKRWVLLEEDFEV
jgi:hypothetical protein